MAANDDDQLQDQQGFSKGFNSDNDDSQAVQPGADQQETQGDDGATPAEGATDDSGAAPAAGGDASGGDQGAAAAPIPANGSAQPTGTDNAPEPAPTDAGATPAAPTGAQPSQQEASWTGRLNAREADLKKREAEIAAREAKLKGGEGSPEEEKGETGKEEAGEQEREHMGYEDAVKMAAEDFGPQFVSMIKAIAGGEASKTAQTAAEQLHDHISNLQNGVQKAFANLHFATLADKHGDFMDVVQSAPFKQWVASQSPEEQSKVQGVVEKGYAPQVIRVLDEFKKSLKGNGSNQPTTGGVRGDAGMDEEALARAAGGVRSSGGNTPEPTAGKAAGNETDRFKAGFNA